MRIDTLAGDLLNLSNIYDGTIFAKSSVIGTWQRSNTLMMAFESLGRSHQL